MKAKDEFRYAAYDAANGEYGEFKTVKEAEDWLTENDGEGISEYAVNGCNWIAEIQYRSVVTKTKDKNDYCTHADYDEDCPENCGKEPWPYCSDFDWAGNHHYEKIEW
jgi:hypothetical protein